MFVLAKNGTFVVLKPIVKDTFVVVVQHVEPKSTENENDADDGVFNNSLFCCVYCN